MSGAPEAPDDALRAALLAIEDLRGDLLRLAARVVALGEEVERLGGGPGLDDRIEARVAELVPDFQAADLDAPGRLHLGPVEDKYAVGSDDGPPCAELLPICGARCCTFEVALSTQDLDEGVLRFDHGRPYLLRHEPDRWCTHLDRDGHGCTVYAHRPVACRRYDCRDDPRVWVDYARRELAPLDAVPDRPASRFELLERVRRRELALLTESLALRRR